MYSWYYIVLHYSSGLCSSILQLYRTYYLYHLVLRCSSYLCVSYLYYYASMTQTPRALAEPPQLVESTSSHRPRLAAPQEKCWRSCSGRPPSTVNPLALPYPHLVHPTDQACQYCPSKPFLNWHSKWCQTFLYFSSVYIPLQSIFEPTHQVMWSSPIIPQQITCPYKPFLNRHAKICDPVPYFSPDYLPLQAIF